MKDPKRWYSMKKNDKTGEIYVYDEIGAGLFGGISAKQFVDDLAALGDVGEIYLYINSPGGDVFDGVSIFNALKRHSAAIMVHIDGLAASIASIVAMAGDKITIAENGMMMIHSPWSVIAGNAAEMRKTADVLDQVENTLVNTYTDRTGIDAAEIRTMMAAETWLEGPAAVEKGFADSTTTPAKLGACAGFDLSRFRNIPQTWLGRKPEPEVPKPVDHKTIIADMEHWLHMNRVAHKHPLVK